MELELKWLCQEEEWHGWYERLTEKSFYGFLKNSLPEIYFVDQFKVENFYFDTKTASLKKEHIALRYRKQKDERLYTVKQKIKSNALMECREEIEKKYHPIDPKETFPAFNALFWKNEYSKAQTDQEKQMFSKLLHLNLQEDFECIAEIIFNRKIFHLDFETFSIELSFDKGLLYSKKYFYEIEFEYKSGHVQSFENFVKDLLHATQKEACSDSKLKRYLLDKENSLEKNNKI